jgi:DNA repair exonuclease SbcCD nuclease subunit
MQYGLEERRKDFSAAFSHVVDAAVKLEVDFFIIAGDLFDNPRPSSATLTDVIAELNRLKKHGIPVLVVNGSHDTAQSAETSILTPLDKAELLRFLPLYGSEGWSNEECYVYGLFNYSSRLRLLQELPNFLSTNPPNPEKQFNICVLHQGLESPGFSVPYPLEILPNELPQGFQYYASGHLHRHTILKLKDPNAIFVYSGATETKDLREAEEKKGFCYVQVKSKSDVEIEHREIPTRKFVRATLECNELNPDEVEEKAIQRLARLDCEGCIVALTLEGILPKGFKRYQVNFNALYAAKQKALHFQILNHLAETHPRALKRSKTLHPRNLHDRVLPYLQEFIADSKLRNDDFRPGSAQRGVQKAEAVWQVLEESRNRKNTPLSAGVAEKLTELADSAPTNP